MKSCRLLLILGLWFLLLNGLNLSYGAGDVTTAGRMAITSSTAEAASGSALFINAKDYGVIGDGATDDMPAMIALLADPMFTNGGHIHFPCGTYRVKRDSNAGFTVVYDNMTISGDGPCTIFQGRDQDNGIPNSRGDERRSIFDIYQHHHLTLKDFAVEGFLTILRARHADDIVLTNLRGDGHLANAGNYNLNFGVIFADNERILITGCRFTNYNDAVYLGAYLNSEVEPFDPLPAPLTVRSAIVTGNSFENNRVAGEFITIFPVGVYVWYAKDTIISNNTFKNIYSSVDNGTYATGMGYSIYDGDGVSTGLTIANNTVTYTGNGLKNGTGILVGSDSNTVVRGNNLRSTVGGRMIYGIRSFRSTLSTTATPITNRLFADNVIRTESKEGTADNLGIWISSSPTSDTNLEISGNAVSGPWDTAIRVDSETKSRVQVLNNLVIGGEKRQVILSGTGTIALQQGRIAGNRLLNGKTNGIEVILSYGTIIENNTILDGNLNNASDDTGAAIFMHASAHGAIVRNNVIGNTPQGAGLFSKALVITGNASSSYMFKNIVYGNSLIGFNMGSAVYVQLPIASPTVGFYDIDFGDIVYNAAIAAGGVPGWICTKASRVAITADASNASTTVTVTSTTGYAAGDLVMLSKTNNPFDTEYDDVNSYHATTIASVTNSTTFVLTTAIPVGDGTYVSGTAQLKRAVFKPLAPIGS